MSEKLTEQSRAELTDSVKDLVDVDVKGRARVPKGSVGSDYVDESGKRHYTKGGSFLSDYELEQIALHADQIHEGYSTRESENMLENAVGILEDPNDIRESLFMHGYIDEDDYDDWSDDEIMAYVADARKDVAEHSDTPEVVEAEEYTPKHRAEYQDENSPLYDELARKYELAPEWAREDESRQPGRHVADVAELDTSHIDRTGLDYIGEPRADESDQAGGVHIDRTGLELLDTADDTPTVLRTWRQRLRDMASPAGLASELGRLSSTAREKLGGHKKAALALGVLAAGAGVGIYLLNRNNGGSATGAHMSGGNWFNDILSHTSDTVKDAADAAGHVAEGAKDTATHLSWDQFSEHARHITSGEGWYGTFQDMKIPKEHWATILNEAGPKLQHLGEAYYDNNAGEWRISHTGELSGKSLQVLAAASEKAGYSLAS